MRRRRTRMVSACVALALIAATFAGCGEREELRKEELLKVIAATRPLAHSFVYIDQPLGGSEIRVVGVVEDSLRFKARLSLNGEPVKEEVGVDDALAVRFLDPGRIGLFVDEARAADAVKAPTSTDGSPLPTPLETLEAGRWVVDPTGAPSLLPRADTDRLEGEDPVLDALAVLDYVARIVDRNGVARYNKDALQPVYKPAEDRFPKPSQDAPVTRYDVPLARFPKASDTGGRNVVIVPGVENFRKLSIFVKDGRVVEIHEDIDVRSRMDDLKRNFDVKTDFTVEQAITAINEVRKSKGEDPFRPRRMRLELEFERERVALPAEGEFLQAPLSFFRFRGAERLRAASSEGATSGSTASTSTSTVESVPPSTPSA